MSDSVLHRLLSYGWRESFRPFLYLFIPFALVLSAISYNYYHREMEAVRKITSANEMHQVALERTLIFREVHPIVTDLRVLTTQSAFLQTISEESVALWQALKNDYVAFLDNKKIYDQIRFIDLDGMERIRVNYNDGDPYAVPDQELQNKKNRYYFTNSIRLSIGEVYVSPLDLNIEHGEVERPIKPMIRFATPVYDQRGNKRGILILNYLARKMLNNFETAHRDAGGAMMLLNPAGYWLHSPDPREQWGFMFPEMKEVSFAARYPQAWKVISRQDGGQFMSEAGLFTFATVYPLLEGWKSSQILMDGTLAKPVDYRAYHWKVVSLLPVAALAGEEEGLAGNVVSVFAALLLIGGALLWLFSLTSFLRHKVEEGRISSAIHEEAIDGIIACDQQGVIFEVNPSARRLLKAARADLIGKRFVDLIKLEADSLEEASKSNIVEGEATFPDGSTANLEMSVSRLYYPGINGHTCFIRDITERKTYEAERKKLYLAIEHASEAIILFDHAGRIEYANPILSDYSGYSQEELLCMDIHSSIFGEQDRDSFSQIVETVKHRQAWQGSVLSWRKDGDSFPANLVISAVFDDSGRVGHLVAVLEDLSKWKTLEEQFRQAQKMEAIGELVGGIAHDFNNVLASVTGGLFLLKGKVAEKPEALADIELIENLSFRAADMVHGLLGFARKGKERFAIFDLNPFFKEAVKLCELNLKQQVFLRYDFPKDSLPVRGDLTQIQQMLVNLSNNALHAMETSENATLALELSRYKADKSFADRHGVVLHAGYARLTVEDNGEGIAEENIAHIFEPFFTTKDASRGTGLGLAMVAGAVRDHHGVIEVDSKPGRGTRIDVYFPLATEPGREEAIPEKGTGVVIGRGESILFVEDDPHLREIGVNILRQLGYSPLAVESGEEALRMIAEVNGDVSLVMSDVTMPGIGGIHAAEEIHAQYPDIPFLFVSGTFGGPSFESQRAADRIGRSLFVSKPYHVAEISKTIRELID